MMRQPSVLRREVSPYRTCAQEAAPARAWGGPTLHHCMAEQEGVQATRIVASAGRSSVMHSLASGVVLSFVLGTFGWGQGAILPAPCPDPQYPPEAGTTVLDLANPIIVNFQDSLDLRTRDLDGDEDLDLIVWGQNLATFRNSNLSFSLWNDASAPFYDLQIVSPNSLRWNYDLAFSDVDADGDLDIVTANASFQDMILEWHEGEFLAPAVSFNRNDQSQYWKCTGGGSLLACGDQSCNYALPAGSLCTFRFSMGLDMADLDSDGDDDAVFCYRDTRPCLFLNDGDGIIDETGDTVRDSPFFEWQKMPAPPDEPLVLDPLALDFNPFPGAAGRDIHLADLDLDGDLDCVVGRDGNNNAGCSDIISSCIISPYETPIIYKNNGYDSNCIGGADPGTPFLFWYKLIGPTPSLQGPNGTLSLEVKDVNCDGYEDVIVPVRESPAGVTYKTRVYINKRNGIVGITPVLSGGGTVANYQPDLLVGDADDANARTTAAEVVDIDANGRPDMLIAHSRFVVSGFPKQPDKIFLNQGNDANELPVFEKFDVIGHVPGTSGVGDDTRYVRPVDIDGDGDLDYLEANFNGTYLRILRNRKNLVTVRPPQ